MKSEKETDSTIETKDELTDEETVTIGSHRAEVKQITRREKFIIKNCVRWIKW